MHLPRRWSGILACLLVLPGLGSVQRLAAQVQASTGLIRGVVSDTATGAPIAGAEVTVRNVETNDVRSITTNSSGTYVAPLLRVGTYDVLARSVGYTPAERKAVPVRLGEPATVDLALRPQAVQLQEITAEAIRAVTEPDRVAAATRLDDQVVSGLPNNGRNFLNLTLLTPNVAIVQGPDGDELTIGGQRGIHNNVSVDGADFNNPFFGEQRGGQRPPFTFNLDAVQEMVVVAQGSNAEFGRSGGGFVNIITKSGTNELHGSLHYFGKYDALSSDYSHTFPGGTTSGFAPDFTQHQFGFTLGGPIKRDRAFFFLAYDQQVYHDVKQQDRLGLIDPTLVAFLDTAFSGALNGDFGPIRRTNNAIAGLAKFDFRLSAKHNLSLKYNYTWSRQENGTFDVDLWGRSSNGVERDWSHAVNGALRSLLSSAVSNEFRFQLSREDRPRPYEGSTNPATGRPFPDTDASPPGFRFGMPYFLPVQSHDTRIQLLDNVSFVQGSHLFKAGAEWNRTQETQTFVGFANGRMAFTSVPGFINYVRFGNGYVECANGVPSLTGSCPPGVAIIGPVDTYLQFAGVGGLTADEAGTQKIPQHELAIFLQDSWKPRSNLTVDYGLRWEAQIEPDPITPPDQVFFAPFIGQTVTNSVGTFTFPSNGKIPSDYKMFQPRLGVAWDVKGDARTVLRGSAGLYYARIPGLNLASIRSTNGSVGQTIFRNSALTGILGPPPNYGELVTPPAGPFDPNVFVADQNFENPRTFSATVGVDQAVTRNVAVTLAYTHARTDHLTRFIDRNDNVFGNPWRTGLPGGNGIASLTTVESTARSRYHGITVGTRGTAGRYLQFEANYTLSFDKADDDNERDPFTFRYARADNLAPEYNWSDRDQRHRFNLWFLARLPGDVYLNSRVSAYSAQPTSERCINNQPSGQRAASPQDRICTDRTILLRNTIRRDNAFFSWDLRLSRPFQVGHRGQMELLVEVFNLLNHDNFKDPSAAGLYKNFDGTIRSGLGDPRQVQTGLRYLF
jgi:hypothetical protein